MIKFLSTLLLIFCWGISLAQNKYTISGYVKDQKNGEELIGVSIQVKELAGTGAVTNAYGFYSVTLPEGQYTLVAQYMGYDSKTTTIRLNQPVKQDFSLSESSTQLQEVVVKSEKANDNITRNQMGMEKLSIKDIEQIPVLMGERDVLKTIQLIPGIKSAGEGSSGFYVRGGGADQNLILLDEATVYNASHLLGFFSVFNSDAIKDVTIYKGNSPAAYGGRLSSVLDIKMNEGNSKRFGASGGIGLISSRLNLEGPIIKDKGSFMISGRRTYADMFLKLSNQDIRRNSSLYFYDTNLKANYRINDKNRIFLSGYFGKDVLGFNKMFNFNWGNATGTLRWNHLVNDRLFSNTSLIISNYDYNIGLTLRQTNIDIISRIQDYNIKQDFEYYAGTGSTLKFGFNTVYHAVTPGVVTITGVNSINRRLSNRNAWENAAYASHELALTDRLNFTYGLRLNVFSALGPGNFYTYSAMGEAIDTTSFRAGQIVKTYVNPEPRLSASYILDENSSIKAAYARNTQNLHLISNSTTGSPTDLWIPSSNNVKPQIADQVSLGYYRNFMDNVFEFSTEAYYKHMQNQIDYRDGAQLNFNEAVESQLLFGQGRAYGVEFFLKKKAGRFNGWVGYTLSRTERQIDGINDRNWYPARQDRTHDISVVGMYELSPKWSLSGTWVYYTGNAVTFPSGKYEAMGHVVNYYTERNGYRMPDYHRMDLGATWMRKKTERFESSWTFSVYNLYGRENAFMITFEQNQDDPSRSDAVQTSLFRMVPSVTYNFKF